MLSRLALPFALSLCLTASSAFAGQWDPQFGAAEFPNIAPNGSIDDFLVEGNDLYVVGGFTSIGGVTASHVAKWDGTTWNALGVTIGGGTSYFANPFRIVRYKQFIVVTGHITSVNGQPGNVALWNGSSWTSLNISPPPISGLDSDADNLYISASTEFGGSTVYQWNGAVLTPLGPSLPGWLMELLHWDNKLYAAGPNFSVGSSQVGVWNGTQWTGLGNGPNSYTLTLLVDNGQLVASWPQTQYPPPAPQRWNGTSWAPIATTIVSACGISNEIGRAFFFQNQFYCTNVHDGAKHGIATLKNGAWDDMKGGTQPECGGGPLAEYQGRLLVGGCTTAGGMTVPGLAQWTGTDWYTRGTNGPVEAIAATGSDVFVAGDFENAHDTAAHHIARWDGSSWHALSSGINGTVHSAVVVGTDLYVGGEFTDAGGSGAINLARWNGTAWSSVGSSLGGPVYALATDGSDLYFGGNFVSFQSGQFLQRIGRWDGTSFHSLGTGVDNNSVHAIDVNNGKVYAGGDFTTAGGVPTGNTAYWDGSWHTVGYGLPQGTVRALENHQGILYAAGDFTLNFTLQHFAAYDGIQWTPIPGVNGTAHSLLSVGSNLYITGEFTLPTEHIASYNGTSWSPLDTGLNGPGRALTVGPQGLWVGGEFTNSGAVGAGHIAHWIPAPTAVLPSMASVTSLEPVFPNPFNPMTNIRYRVGSDSRVTIAIFDVQGRRVRQLLDEDVHGSAAPHVITWNGTTDTGTPSASGVYFVRMSARGYNETRKIVLLK